jgi:hypothetical protein
MFVGCADAVPYDVLVNDEPYGFWGGLWHGLTFPISFFGSLLDSDIAMYAVNNNGGWYNFGFWLGAGGLGYWVGGKASS